MLLFQALSAVDRACGVPGSVDLHQAPKLLMHALAWQMLTPALRCVGAAVSLMALKFIAIFGIMGIPIFISLATCNEVRSCHISIPPTPPYPLFLCKC